MRLSMFPSLLVVVLACTTVSAATIDISGVSSWFRSLSITSPGEGKVSIPAEYAIIHATVDSQRSIKTEKETTKTTLDIFSELASSTPSASAPIRIASTPAATPLNDTELIRLVQQDTATKTDAVIQYLKKQGKDVWNVETTSVSVQPDYDYSSNRPTIWAYRATVTLTFRVIVANAGVVMDGLTGAGVTRIDSVSYGVSDEKIAAAEKSAVENAVLNAQSRAQAAYTTTQRGNDKKESKETLSISSMEIQFVGGSFPYPGPYPPIAYDRATSSAGKASVSTPILATEQIITCNLIAKFETSNK